MHIDAVPSRASRRRYLRSESYRQGTKVRKSTLASLSALFHERIGAIRAVFSDGAARPVEEFFEAVHSLPYGHVHAVRVAMHRLGFEALITSRLSAGRERVYAMVAARVLSSDTKLATTRSWHTTTLAEEYGVAGADEGELYAVMDRLPERRGVIEPKRAARQLKESSLAMYERPSSYFECGHCPLAKIRHYRGGKKNEFIVNHGVLTAQRPPGSGLGLRGQHRRYLNAHAGGETAQERFHLEPVVVVGDQGMIWHKAIGELREIDGLGWITALKSGEMRTLVVSEVLQRGLFDERNLVELSHPDYPGERRVAGRDPEVAKLRVHKHRSLMGAAQKELEKVCTSVSAGRLKAQEEIGVRVERLVNKDKVAKHIAFSIEEQRFDFQILEDQVAADTVPNCEGFCEVGRTFRARKRVELKFRSTHHRLEDRVRAHIFLCMFAYCVEWHMKEAWRELLFVDEDLEAKQRHDPIAPAQRFDEALLKAVTHILHDGALAHSFRTLLEDLANMVRHTCVTRPAKTPPSACLVITSSSAAQHRALQLLQRIVVRPARRQLMTLQLTDQQRSRLHPGQELRANFCTTGRRSNRKRRLCAVILCVTVSLSRGRKPSGRAFGIGESPVLFGNCGVRNLSFQTCRSGRSSGCHVDGK